MADLRFSGIEHGRFSLWENRAWPIVDLGKPNMADFRFWKIEHDRFSNFGNRTWPIFDVRVEHC